jgi:hypothetical protein
MGRSELIDDILRLTPAAADDGHRARPLLATMTEKQLREARNGLSVLKKSGADVLAGMTPAQRDEVASLLRGGAADAERVKRSLNEVEARVQVRAAKVSLLGRVQSEFKELYDAVRSWANLPSTAIALASREIGSALAFENAISHQAGGGGYWCHRTRQYRRLECGIRGGSPLVRAPDGTYGGSARPACSRPGTDDGSVGTDGTGGV